MISVSKRVESVAKFTHRPCLNALFIVGEKKNQSISRSVYGKVYRIPVGHDRPREKTRNKSTSDTQKQTGEGPQYRVDGGVRIIKVGQNSHHVEQQGHLAEKGILVDDAEEPRSDEDGESEGHIGGVADWERNCNPDKEPTNPATIQAQRN